MSFRNLAGLAGAIALCAMVPAASAFAQQQPPAGTTSGPAAGSNVEPGTVTQKKAHPTGANTSDGAPGMQGPKGSENGAKPDKKSPN